MSAEHDRPAGRTTGVERCHGHPIFGSGERGGAKPRKSSLRPTGRSGTKPGEDGQPVVQPKQSHVAQNRPSGRWKRCGAKRKTDGHPAALTKRSHVERSRPSGRWKRSGAKRNEDGHPAALTKRSHVERSRPSGRWKRSGAKRNEDGHRPNERGLVRTEACRRSIGDLPRRTVAMARASSRGSELLENAAAASIWRQRRVGRVGLGNVSVSAGA
jgi:hypothetical protein